MTEIEKLHDDVKRSLQLLAASVRTAVTNQYYGHWLKSDLPSPRFWSNLKEIGVYYVIRVELPFSVNYMDEHFIAQVNSAAD